MELRKLLALASLVVAQEVRQSHASEMVMFAACETLEKLESLPDD